jgi:prepilin-type N-terminal cleavage/methylation domain-containing protein
MNRGFTILEMLLAAVLLVVGTSAVVGTFGMAMSADAGMEASAVALALAQEEMESIKDAASWAAIDGFASARTQLGAPFAGFDRQVTASGDPKEVTVTVYWKVKGVDQQVSLATLMSNYNY